LNIQQGRICGSRQGPGGVQCNLVLPEKRRYEVVDRLEIIYLRSCLMKPEHYDWIKNILAILDDVANIAMG
jgi:hypothetical protein